MIISEEAAREIDTKSPAQKAIEVPLVPSKAPDSQPLEKEKDA